MRNQRLRFLSQPTSEVDEATFDHARSVVPPIPCMVPGADIAFFVGEPMTDGVHRQYARFGDRFMTRFADPCDRSTFLTAPAG